jgi:two-component sensor histidine kinase
MVPLGLIINEIIINAIKYAFPKGFSKKDEETRTITISTSLSEDDNAVIVIGDNGVGFPDDIDFRHTNSLGMNLITALVKQFHGDISLSNKNGTQFSITVPLAGERMGEKDA